MKKERVIPFWREWKGCRTVVKLGHSQIPRRRDNCRCLARRHRWQRVSAAPVSAFPAAWPYASTPPWPRLPYSARGVIHNGSCLVDRAYPGDDFLYLFLMTLHLQNAPNLHQVDLLSVAQAHNLIKRPKQLERVLRDFSLVCATAHVRHDTSKELQCLYILQDVRGFVCDKNDVEVFKELVDIANFGRFDRRVLRISGYKFGKGGQQGVDPGPRHIPELSRNHS